jgi:acyl carrier protein
MNALDAQSMILDVLRATELIDESRKQDVLAGRAGDIELAGLKIDSMKIIDLCLGLEERMGRQIRVEELIENPTLKRLADHFAKARS